MCFVWVISTVSPGGASLYKHLDMPRCDNLGNLVGNAFPSTFLLVPRVESVISSVSSTPRAASIHHRPSTLSNRELCASDIWMSPVSVITPRRRLVRSDRTTIQLANRDTCYQTSHSLSLISIKQYPTRSNQPSNLSTVLE